MDFFSHGLWSGAVYKTLNIKTKNRFKIWLSVIFGVLPDFFSFAPIFVWGLWQFMFNNFNLSYLRPSEIEPAQQDTLPIFQLTSFLYEFSHSLFIFFIFFGLAYLIFKRPVWEMSGWFFHILIDIPSHSYQFYPTPFLWPFSHYYFNGLAWGNLYFLILNYSAIIFVYFILFYRHRKKR